MCMCAYQNGLTHSFIVATSEGTIQIFTDFVLSWAAKVSSVPVQIAVGRFGTQSGLIVTIDDVGQLSIGYLGTKPPVNAVSLQNNGNANNSNSNREINYDKIDEEHRALLQVST